MKTPTVRTIALVAVMAAVVCVLTYIVQIPVPATGGYVHLGDVGANFAALAFGPGPGFLIAGGGMAIADLIAGYATYAPGTLVIHGLQAVVVALIGLRPQVLTFIVNLFFSFNWMSRQCVYNNICLSCYMLKGGSKLFQHQAPSNDACTRQLAVEKVEMISMYYHLLSK